MNCRNTSFYHDTVRANAFYLNPLLSYLQILLYKLNTIIVWKMLSTTFKT